MKTKVQWYLLWIIEWTTYYRSSEGKTGEKGVSKIYTAFKGEGIVLSGNALSPIGLPHICLNAGRGKNG